MCSTLRDHHGRRHPRVMAERHVPVPYAQPGGACGDGAADPQPGLPAVLDVHLGVRPEQSAGRAERLREGLLRGEPGGERGGAPPLTAGQQQLPFHEEPFGQLRRTLQRRVEPFDLGHVDPDPDDHARSLIPRYSTVTDFARLRGWSTSLPRAVASSQAKTWSGTVDTSGWSSVGVMGIRIRWSAYGTTASSPSSAMTMVRAPRALISWMFDTILSCSSDRPRGDGTTTTTGRPSSMSAIGPCLSSPAAKPSACMYASSLSFNAPSRATG